MQIALIDDGVDINEISLLGKITGGRSFCKRDEQQNLLKAYYESSSGHRTVMASLICRVCPRAKLFVVKLDEYLNKSLARQITAKSAAKVSASQHAQCPRGSTKATDQQAVQAAIDRTVHIISMSWTIERTKQNADDIRQLEEAITAAANAGILMFCAANDQGIARDQSFPAACAGTKLIFKIGVAESSGAVWKWVGDPTDVDFIFPGHRVVKDRPNYTLATKCDILTGSSVATAIASGLAAFLYLSYNC